MAWRGRVKVAVGAGPETGVLTGALQVHLADGGRGVAVLSLDHRLGKAL